MQKLINSVGLFLITLLMACSGEVLEPTKLPADSPLDSEIAYPYPYPAPPQQENVEGASSLDQITPYPDIFSEVSEILTEEDALKITATVPTPGEDTGVVVGRLFSIKMEAPLANMGVYLGEYIYLTPGPDYMVSIRQESSPNTVADAAGNFVIGNVPPGEYPILAWTPMNSYVIPDETGEKEFVVVVIAGQVTDLGEIRINWP